MKKKRYIVLIIFVAIIAIVLYLFLTFSNMYTVKAVAVEAGKTVSTTQVSSRFDFGDIPQGEQVTKSIVLENTGDNDHTIRIWMIGSIGKMIDIEPSNSFELKAGTSMDVNFTLTMPESAREAEKYTGRVILLRLP